MSVENILRWYHAGTEYDRSVGRGWYQAARIECQALAEQYGLDLERVIYAVAALSPQLKWEQNMAAARAVINGAFKVGGVYDSNVEKALHVLLDADDWRRWLSGPKVTSFARNLLGDPDTVTVDTWAWRIWAGTDVWAKPPNLERLYDRIAADYREAAAQVGMEPRQLQAATWITIRRVANGRAAAGQLSLDL